MPERKKILIIDDEQDIIESVEEILSEIGEFTMLSANNGLEGLEKAMSYKPDLIILDLQLPLMHGFRVFKKLKEDPSTNQIPIIILTGISEKQGLSYNAKDMGITLGEEPNAYIEKPMDPEEFLRTVSKILGQK